MWTGPILLASSAIASVPNAQASSVPDSGVGLAIGSEALLVMVVVFAIVALAALANVVTARKEARMASRLARAHAQSMHDLVRTVRMAESIAEIGVWQYDSRAGTQQWSDGLKRLFGIEEADDFVEGDAETLLFANDIDLVGKIKQHSAEREPYTLKFDIYGFDAVPRTISIQACNLIDKAGEVQRVVAVVRDITQQVVRERQLETSRKVAMNEAHQARLLAQTDALTGLANRRQVMDQLDKLVMNARVTQMPMVLVMFDIDHFKHVNDTYGHPEGDKVLRRVAQIARGQARADDLVGRVGGEEFVWILPGASDGMARVMSERLRQAIAEESAVGAVPPVTISLGYTGITAGDTALSLFARADSALYEAKHSGRNRVRMAA